MITGLLAIIWDAVTRSLRAPMGMILLGASLLLISLVGSLGISTDAAEPGGTAASSRLVFVVWTVMESPPGAPAFQAPILGHTIGYLLASVICGWIGIIAAIVATSDYMTSAAERGRIELTLSRPLPRWLLVLAEYCSGLAFVAVLASLVIGGSWLAMGIRLGYWHMGYLLAIPITVCLFALLNATAILAGVVFRHWTLSIVVPIAFWALCTMVAAAKNILDGMRSTPGAQLGITMDRAAEAMDLLYIILPRPGSFAELNSAVINEEFSLGADMFSSISVGPWSMVASAAWTAGCLLVACVVFSRREL